MPDQNDSSNAVPQVTQCRMISTSAWGEVREDYLIISPKFTHDGTPFKCAICGEQVGRACGEIRNVRVHGRPYAGLAHAHCI